MKVRLYGVNAPVQIDNFIFKLVTENELLITMDNKNKWIDMKSPLVERTLDIDISNGFENARCICKNTA